MPIFDVECIECGFIEEKTLSLEELLETKCSKCGGNIKRLYSGRNSIKWERTDATPKDDHQFRMKDGTFGKHPQFVKWEDRKVLKKQTGDDRRDYVYL
ncbi:MAG: zinc ribbon domain-containing protein [Bacteroidetes bacterium]|nr:zinc ribbon domain-containing protein [Bacteroidota bacterium]